MNFFESFSCDSFVFFIDCFQAFGFENDVGLSLNGFPNFLKAKNPPAASPKTINVIPTARPAAIPTSIGAAGLKQCLKPDLKELKILYLITYLINIFSF